MIVCECVFIRRLRCRRRRHCAVFCLGKWQRNMINYRHSPQHVRTTHDSAGAHYVRLGSRPKTRTQYPHPHRSPAADDPSQSRHSTTQLPPPPQPFGSACERLIRVTWSYHGAHLRQNNAPLNTYTTYAHSENSPNINIRGGICVYIV